MLFIPIPVISLRKKPERFRAQRERLGDESDTDSDKKRYKTNWILLLYYRNRYQIFNQFIGLGIRRDSKKTFDSSTLSLKNNLPLHNC